MRMLNLKCPNCGANLDIDADRDEVYCSYCGTLAYTKLDSKIVEEHIETTRNEAEILKLRMKEKEREENRAWRNRNNPTMIKIIILGAVLLALGLLLPEPLKTGLGAIGMGILVVCGWIYIFKSS